MARNKRELLLVLERPEISLNNNLSEGDIPEYVKRRKINGGTRNEDGRRCRDTFASIKKMCRKLGISFCKKPATKARKGINPFTKEEMMFKAKPARKVIKGRPLKAAKEAVA